MRRTVGSLIAIASAGLFLSAGARADEPPFQTSPGQARPAQPVEPPPFTERNSPSAEPDPAAPPVSAPPAPAGTPDFGAAPAPSPAAPAAAPPAPAPAVTGPAIRPLGVAPGPATAAPSKAAPARKPRATPKRPEPAPRTAARPKKKAKKGERAASLGLGSIATFPAFRMTEGGGSRVFVQVSGKTEVTEHKAQGRIVYRMQHVEVPTRTNRLPLDTSFFATPVSQVRLVPQGEDVDLVIDLRQASEARYHVEAQRDGVVVIVDFPPAIVSGVPTATAAAAPPRSRLSTSTTRISSGSGPDF